MGCNKKIATIANRTIASTAQTRQSRMGPDVLSEMARWNLVNVNSSGFPSEVREILCQEVNHSIFVLRRGTTESRGMFGFLHDPQFFPPTRGLVDPFCVLAGDRTIASAADQKDRK